MGFLKFLKREKKPEFEELDLPPEPPPLEGFEEGLELPDFPEFEEEKISAPEEAKTPDLEEELPEFKFPEDEEKLPELGEEEKIPDFPEFEEEKPMAPIPPVRAPPSVPEPLPSIPQPIEAEKAPKEGQGFAPSDTYPKIERRLFAHEKRILRERPTSKTIYVKVDRFKATLGNINMVRNDLRKSEEGLTKLENIKNAKDKSFDKARASLDDLQRKLIFIDKTLFKGD